MDKKDLKMWTIISAQKVVSIIQKKVRRKWEYNVCIYGSVLYKGYSSKDLDIQLIPASEIGDRYHESDVLAQVVADAVNGVVSQKMKLKAIGEMCYIIDFISDRRNRRIDMVVRRTVIYLPTEDEILKHVAIINEKKELLRRCAV